MNDAHILLPREVSALVHHVELNRAGWWDKTLNRLVLAAVWLESKNPDASEICRAMHKTFGLTVSKERLASIIASLKAEDYLVEISDGVYRIPDKARSEFDREIADAENAETKAREHFVSLVTQSCPALDASQVWKAFEQKFLIPMVRDIGANTYRLIAGEAQTFHVTHAESFLAAFAQEHQSSLNAILANFLDPKIAEVRDYITRMLHAHFCVEASGLSGAVLEKLKITTATPLRFRLFVDTNFLFSLLGLHENPSNTSARELKDLLATLRTNPQVDLYITPRTITEAKGAIGAAKAQVSGVPRTGNFTELALRTGISGMCVRFFDERRQRNGMLTANDWFDPYLEDFVPLARAAGVELYNENLDAYGTRQDVVDDIHLVMEYEKKHFPENRRKSYEKVAHDVILWHFVKDRRPPYVESPVEAQEWILTVDFRLIGFDQHKLNASGSNVPLCLHPSALIPLLQFWVPRTQEFEEAILGGLRLPFLFQEFDVQAERLSLVIINRLGRFQGSEHIPEETLINVVMNDGLRSRMKEGQPEEEEIQLVRDALVEQMLLEAQAEKARVAELTAVLENRSNALEETREDRDAKAAEIKELQNRLSEEEVKLRTADKRLSRLTDEQSKLASAVALLTYLGLLVLLVCVSGIAGWWAGRALPDLSDILGSYGVSVVSGLSVFLLTHLLLEWFVRQYPTMTRLWPFRQVRRFRKWLWFLAVTLLLGVAASLIATNILNRQHAPPSGVRSTPSTLLRICALQTAVGDQR